MKNVYHIKVRWGDTDAAAIVFYPNFYKWMDEATHELLEKAGWPLSTLQKDENIILPLLEAFCQFKAPLMHEDRINIESEVTEAAAKVFTVRHTFFKEGNIGAEGYEKRAWTSIADTAPKAVPMPDSIRTLLLEPDARE
ncbi:acyl-CoA thioesterase [Salibacterium aidingense]|uniref:acyl-CoA thioesterase n=1 Tax=Salibacterium aidingense TaxID=384933 RepID=UPI003BCA01E6